MAEEQKDSKPTRVALTKKQATEGLGLELVKLAKNWLGDGKLSDAELGVLRDWLNRCPSDSPPAIQFLREEVARYVADGKIEEWELDRLFSALARVIPPAERSIANESRKKLRKAREEAERPAREAKRAAAFQASREYWREMRERYADEWEAEPASDAQAAYIRELGGSLPDGASKLDAAITIDKLLNTESYNEDRGDVPLMVKIICVLGILAVILVTISKLSR